MVLGKIKEKKAGGENVAVAQDEAPAFEKVNWMKEPGLRKLYWHAFILCVASATTGYDGYVELLSRSHSRVQDVLFLTSGNITACSSTPSKFSTRGRTTSTTRRVARSASSVRCTRSAP